MHGFTRKIIVLRAVGYSILLDIRVFYSIYKIEMLLYQKLKMIQLKWSSFLGQQAFALFHFAPFIKSKIPGVPIILDYRDPWNINHSSLIAKYFERKILDTGDFIVLLNEPMKLDIISYFDINKNKCEVILNGYSGQTSD